MSRPGPAYDIGRELRVFIDPETTFGTAATDHPEAADAVRATDAAANGKRPFSAFVDRRGTSSKLGIIDEKGTAYFSLDAPLIPSGAVGTAPDIDDLLLYGGWSKITGTDTTVSGAGSTTTVIDVVSAAGLSAGGCVVISGQVRRITDVDVVAIPDNITITPALSAAPVNATVVAAGVAYYPKDERADAQDSITFWAINNRSAARVVGGVPSSFVLALGGAGGAGITMEGTGRRQDHLQATRLTAGVNDAVVTFPVDVGTCAPADVTTYWQIDSEIVSVTAVSTNDWTVTRGALASVAASHSDNAVIYPYAPVGTYAGSPVPATTGTIVVEGVTLSMQSANFTLDMAPVFAEGRHGDAFSLDHYIVGERAFSVQLEGWTEFETNSVRILRAMSRASQQIFVQQGSTAGSIVAVEFPTAYLEQPDIARGGDEVTLTLSAEARGATAEDECWLMFG